jgi:hypothetical protein
MYMKIALQILLYIFAIISGIGFFGEKNSKEKPYYLAGVAVMVLLIMVIQTKW